MKILFALLGLFALAGYQDTPATGGYTASRASYLTDQPIYTGPQDYTGDFMVASPVTVLAGHSVWEGTQ